MKTVVTITSKIVPENFAFDLEALAGHLREEARRIGRVTLEFRVGRDCDAASAWCDMGDEASSTRGPEKERLEVCALEWAHGVAYAWVSARIGEAAAVLGTRDGAAAQGRILDLKYEADRAWENAIVELGVSPYHSAHADYCAAYRAARIEAAS